MGPASTGHVALVFNEGGSSKERGPGRRLGFPLVECAGRAETSRRWLRVGGQSGILTHGHTSDQLPAERSP
jgi:hypothetical protein